MPSTFAVTPSPAGGTFELGIPPLQLTKVPVSTFEMVVVPVTVIAPEPVFVPDPQPVAAKLTRATSTSASGRFISLPIRHHSLQLSRRFRRHSGTLAQSRFSHAWQPQTQPVA